MIAHLPQRPTRSHMPTRSVRPLLVAALLAAGAAHVAHAQAPAAAPGTAADRAAVRQAVLDYVEGFYEGDTTRLQRSVWPAVRKWGYARAWGADGAYRGMAMPFPDGFLRYAAGVRDGRTPTPANAPKTITLFDVQDQTASAKLTAWWGTDYLLLAREQGRWMITHVLWQTTAPPSPAP